MLFIYKPNLQAKIPFDRIIMISNIYIIFLKHIEYICWTYVLIDMFVFHY